MLFTVEDLEQFHTNLKLINIKRKVNKPKETDALPSKEGHTGNDQRKHCEWTISNTINV